MVSINGKLKLNGHNQIDQIASFLPSDQDNDEDKYRIPWRDKTGHSTSVRTSFHPAEIHAAEHIVDSRRFPFSNVQELQRAALHHFMFEVLMKEQEHVDSAWFGYKLTLKVARDSMYLRQHLEAIGEIEIEVMQLRRDGLFAQVEALIGKERAIIEEMPLGVWRTLYEERLDLIEKGGYSPLDPPGTATPTEDSADRDTAGDDDA